MKQFSKTILFFALVIFTKNSIAQPIKSLSKSKNNNTLLWQIKSKNSKQPSYLFGTFHLLCKDDIVFSNNLKTALQSVNEVYFEIDLDDPSTMLGGMGFMNMANNKKLQDFYTAAEYNKVSTFFKDSLKVNISFFSSMKPMLLEALLYPRMMPCKTPTGVEAELMKLAKAAKKEIKGFETLAFQASVFDSIPYQTQANALLRDIDSTDKYKIYFNKMVQIYKSQEADKLVALMADSSFNETLNEDVLLKNRNANWVEKIPSIVKEKSIFIAVGAAHLYGKNGLIEMLSKKGYILTPIDNTN